LGQRTQRKYSSEEKIRIVLEGLGRNLCSGAMQTGGGEHQHLLQVEQGILRSWEEATSGEYYLAQSIAQGVS